MKAIIFDFDGVLIDSYAYSSGIVRDIGHDVSDEDFKAHHDGNVFEKPQIPFTKKPLRIFTMPIYRTYILNLCYFQLRS